MYINTHIYMCVCVYIYIGRGRYASPSLSKEAYLEDRVNLVLDHLNKVNTALFTQAFWFPVH